MNYSIRKLEESDLLTLAKMMKDAFLGAPWKEVWKEEMCLKRLSIFSSISSSYSYTLINEKNEICGAAIGYVVPFVDHFEYNLQEFFIDAKLLKMHLGTFFMNELIKKAKETGIDTIKFYTAGDLYRFYEKFGYKKINDEYLMELHLQ